MSKTTDTKRFEFVEKWKVYKLDINWNDESGVSKKELLFGDQTGYMKHDYYPIEVVRDLLNTFFPGRSADTKDIKPFTSMADAKWVKSMLIKTTTVLHIPWREIPITVELISVVSAGKLGNDDALYGFNGNMQARWIKTAAKQLWGIFNIKDMFSDVSENSNEKITVIDDINIEEAVAVEDVEVVATVDVTNTVETETQLSDEIKEEIVTTTETAEEGKPTIEDLYKKFKEEFKNKFKDEVTYKKTIARSIWAELLTKANVLPSSDEWTSIVNAIKAICGL